MPAMTALKTLFAFFILLFPFMHICSQINKRNICLLFTTFFHKLKQRKNSIIKLFCRSMINCDGINLDLLKREKFNSGFNITSGI